MSKTNLQIQKPAPVNQSKSNANNVNSFSLQNEILPVENIQLSKQTIIQPKLGIGKPGDGYEQEADSFADRILMMPDVSAKGKNQTKPIAENISPLVQASFSKTSEELISSSNLESKLNNSKNNGNSLPENTRTFMESRFGADFSNVKIHTDSNAFTYGSDIYFNRGKFNPENSSGKHLLAHELTHVVQQNNSLSRSSIVQCYEGYEHKDIGDRYLGELLAFLKTDEGAEWANKYGLNRDNLVAQISKDPMFKGGKIQIDSKINEKGKKEFKERTPGEIIALMGDLFGSYNQLANAPSKNVNDILDVMEKERNGTITSGDATNLYEKYTGDNYLKLAAGNNTHFSRKNKEEWNRLHKQAIDEAKAVSKNKDNNKYQHALFVDAASCHFLTDAFSAGHLFDYNKIIAEISMHLSKNSLIAKNPQMQSYIGIVEIADKLPQLVLKNIHDRLNREGVDVSNPKGMKWKTYGDNYLKSAPETQKIASLAVFLSRQQIIEAYNGGSPNLADIDALMPDEDTINKVTSVATTYIPAATVEVESLIYRNRSVAPTQFGLIPGTIIESNIATIGSPGRERDITQLLDSANRRGDNLGAVAPSFTLFSW
jgi:hypothetical protein